MAESNKKRAETFFKSEVEQYEDTHYGEGRRSFMSVRQEAYLRQVDSLDFGTNAVRTIEAGCGPGLMCAALSERGHEMYAYDTSPEMLRATGERFTSRGKLPPHLLRASIEAPPFASEQFDLCVTAGVIEYLDEDRVWLEEAWRILKPGGYLVASVTNSLSPAGYLDGIVERLKRSPTFLSGVNKVMSLRHLPPVRPRHFAVRKHRPATFERSVEEAGFLVVAREFFHMLPWPHPFDRAMPGLTEQLGRRIEWVTRTPLAPVAEGLLVVGQKSGPGPTPRSDGA